MDENTCPAGKEVCKVPLEHPKPKGLCVEHIHGYPHHTDGTPCGEECKAITCPCGKPRKFVTPGVPKGFDGWSVWAHKDDSPFEDACKAQDTCSNCGAQTEWLAYVGGDDDPFPVHSGSTGGWADEGCKRKPQEKPGPMGEEIKIPTHLKAWEPWFEGDGLFLKPMVHAEIPTEYGGVNTRLVATFENARDWERALTEHVLYPQLVQRVGSLEAENKELQAIIDDPDTNPAFNSCACRFKKGELKQECYLHEVMREEHKELQAQVGFVEVAEGLLKEFADGYAPHCPNFPKITEECCGCPGCRSYRLIHGLQEYSNLPEAARKEMERVKVLEEQIDRMKRENFIQGTNLAAKDNENIRLWKALVEHHNWQLNLGEVALTKDEKGEWIVLDMSAEYGDSTMYEKTQAALHPRRNREPERNPGAVGRSV